VTPLIGAAADLQAVCETHQWRYCFIGGLAVLRWGEPRETVNVDLTLLTLKAFADRPKDWMDIEGIIVRQSQDLDWPYVRAELAPLAALGEAPELVAKLEAARERFTS